MLRNKVLAGVTIAAVLVVPAPVLAVEGSHESERSGVLHNLEKTVESTVDTTRGVTKTVVEETTSTLQSKAATQKERIEARKAELKAEKAKRVEEKKEKLEGRRLARCQNRQEKINDLIDKSASVGQAKLARIQSFEAAIKQFYVDQSLTSESYEAAVASVDAKEAEAIAALETLDAQDYDCADADGANPSGEIRAVHDAKRESLKQYRDSVQELLRVVREAFATKKEALDETE